MQISDNNEDVKHALLTLKDISRNELDRIAAENRDLAIRDMNQMYQDGENAGLKKGIEQGRGEVQQEWDEDKRQTILRCLASGFDIQTIATVTNVSEDIVRKLSQE